MLLDCAECFFHKPANIQKSKLTTLVAPTPKYVQLWRTIGGGVVKLLCYFLYIGVILGHRPIELIEAPQ